MTLNDYVVIDGNINDSNALYYHLFFCMYRIVK